MLMPHQRKTKLSDGLGQRRSISVEEVETMTEAYQKHSAHRLASGSDVVLSPIKRRDQNLLRKPFDPSRGPDGSLQGRACGLDPRASGARYSRCVGRRANAW